MSTSDSVNKAAPMSSVTSEEYGRQPQNQTKSTGAKDYRGFVAGIASGVMKLSGWCFFPVIDYYFKVANVFLGYW